MLSIKSPKNEDQVVPWVEGIINQKFDILLYNVLIYHISVKLNKYKNYVIIYKEIYYAPIFDIDNIIIHNNVNNTVVEFPLNHSKWILSLLRYFSEMDIITENLRVNREGHILIQYVGPPIKMPIKSIHIIDLIKVNDRYALNIKLRNF